MKIIENEDIVVESFGFVFLVTESPVTVYKPQAPETKGLCIKLNEKNKP